MSHRFGMQCCYLGSAVVAVLISLASFSLGDDEAPKPESQKLELSGELQFTIPHVLVAAGEETGYWIGVACHPVSRELRDKLKLEPNQGLVIEEVRPESPAAKAGLKVDDVVLAAAGNKLAEVKQFAQAVGEAKTGKLKLQILRGGERQEIEVQPAPRAAEDRFIVITDDEPNKDDESAKQRQRKEPAPEKNAEASGQIELRLAPGLPGAPPVAVPFAARSAGKPWQLLPDDMKVIIEKQGAQPATIIVEQGDKVWKTTERELEMLPPNAHRYARRLLAGADGMRARATIAGEAGRPMIATLPGGGLKIELREAAEQQQEMLSRRLQEMREKGIAAQDDAVRALARDLEQKRPDAETQRQIRRQLHELRERIEQLERQLEK